MTRSVRRKLDISVKQDGSEIKWQRRVQDPKTFGFQFEAKPGNHIVEVMYEGSHVEGSPWKSRVEREESKKELMDQLCKVSINGCYMMERRLGSGVNKNLKNSSYF